MRAATASRFSAVTGQSNFSRSAVSSLLAFLYPRTLEFHDPWRLIKTLNSHCRTEPCYVPCNTSHSLSTSGWLNFLQNLPQDPYQKYGGWSRSSQGFGNPSWRQANWRHPMHRAPYDPQAPSHPSIPK